MSRESETLAFLNSPAVHFYTYEERLATWKRDNAHLPVKMRDPKPEPRDLDALKAKLARRPYPRTPAYHIEPMCDWLKLAKELERKFS